MIRSELLVGSFRTHYRRGLLIPGPTKKKALQHSYCKGTVVFICDRTVCHNFLMDGVNGVWLLSCGLLRYM